MTKHEQELILSFTELEKAVAKLSYYEDQEDDMQEIYNTLAGFKSKFYGILLEKEE
jgi:hypothetical protein